MVKYGVDEMYRIIRLSMLYHVILYDAICYYLLGLLVTSLITIKRVVSYQNFKRMSLASYANQHVRLIDQSMISTPHAIENS
jgi:hypothetical protein